MDLYTEALNRFRDLLEDARKTNLREPAAATLATTDASGHPTARTMVLKELDERGFAFFTNLDSRKARQLEENPRAALCFYWQTLMQQVVVEGTVELINDEEADAYWVTRERNSQLGAWASKQSSPLDRRETLSKRLSEIKERFMDQRVPRPANWSGYRLVPERIEFWTAGWHRLHERVCYFKSVSGWSVTLLYP